MRTSISRNPVTFINHGLVFTKTEVWGWFVVPSRQHFLLTIEEKQKDVTHLNALLGGLVDGKNEPVDIHIRQVADRFDVAEWKRELTTRTEHLANPAPAFYTEMDETAAYLNDIAVPNIATYLGVKLGDRKDLSNTGILTGGLKSALDVLARPFMGPNLEVGDDEQADWLAVVEATLREVETRWEPPLKWVTQTAKATMPAVRLATAAELVWLMQKPFFDTYEAPSTQAIQNVPLFSEEDIVGFDTGAIIETPTGLEIETVNPRTGRIETTHTAIACITHFSDQFYWPESDGWAEVVRVVDPTVEWSIRGQVLPASVTKRIVQKHLTSVQEEVKDSADSGHDGGRRLQEQRELLEHLEHQVSHNPQKWLKVSYRAQIRGTSAGEVQEKYVMLRQNMEMFGFRLTLPPHDQFDLLLESMPGGKMAQTPYARIQDLGAVAGGGLLSTSRVGDEGVLGPYVGRVEAGDQPPVFFDPNRAIIQNRGPVATISGQPGRGKTALAMRLAHHCAARGYATIFIDPKQDTKGLAEAAGLGGVNFFDLKQADPGVLDPFFFLRHEPGSATMMAKDVIRILAGDWTEAREAAVDLAIERAKTAGNPSMMAVLDALLSHPDPESAAANLGRSLRTTAGTQFGGLLFAREAPTRDIVSATDGLTVITLLGLKQPATDTITHSTPYEERIGVAIMGLLTNYAFGLMMAGDKDYPKALFVDEAWMVLKTNAGRELVNAIGRMGRSHNNSLILVSQNVTDFLDIGLETQISTRFVFGSGSTVEHERQLDFLGVTDKSRAVMDFMASLGEDSRYQGRCLMRDASGRLGLVHVDFTHRMDLMATFTTNPEERAKFAAEAKRRNNKGREG